MYQAQGATGYRYPGTTYIHVVHVQSVVHVRGTLRGTTYNYICVHVYEQRKTTLYIHVCCTPYTVPVNIVKQTFNIQCMCRLSSNRI